ncbi:hypothetical protein N7478_006319 [Penicillium angulare]|uniref:uncharacterized protein n=1 Tax=Penicillium angulare TaxID=116970 RepID=UPI0025415860|nr:uncharacterized protein N7478_006319 [Penicillium angulare]KAJ5280947.1 hypothetical protein N7478_006319 [Penicillium angulare]
MYSPKANATIHAVAKHDYVHERQNQPSGEGTVLCPVAEKEDCPRMFDDQKTANKHVFGYHHVRFGEYHCPEDDCDAMLFQSEDCEEHLKSAHSVLGALAQDALNRIAETTLEALLLI